MSAKQSMSSSNYSNVVAPGVQISGFVTYRSCTGLRVYSSHLHVKNTVVSLLVTVSHLLFILLQYIFFCQEEELGRFGFPACFVNF